MRHRATNFVALLALVSLGADSGGSSTDSVTGLLREFGFPIFVALWFMWRLEKKLDRFVDSLEKLFTIVSVMSKTVDDLPAGPPGPPGPSGPPGPPGPPGPRVAAPPANAHPTE